MPRPGGRRVLDPSPCAAGRSAVRGPGACVKRRRGGFREEVAAMATTDTHATATSRTTSAGPVAAKRPPVVDRLTGEDLSMLWPDRRGWPQDIGVIAVLDASP